MEETRDVFVVTSAGGSAVTVAVFDTMERADEFVSGCPQWSVVRERFAINEPKREWDEKTGAYVVKPEWWGME